MLDWLADILARLVSDPDDRITIGRKIEAARTGDALAYLGACRDVGEAANAALLTEALDTAPIDTVTAAIGALVVHSFLVVRVDYPSRQDAAAARSALSARAEDTYAVAGTAFGDEVLAWLVRLAGEAIVQLSAIAATKAPIVRVETGVSLPSSLLAYDLYADPSRGAELVARNNAGTPFVMPIAIEALAE